jgi:Tfp pilus assembly protein PilV
MRLLTGTRETRDASAVRRAGRAGGFTLIETSIALLIMMIALLSLASLFIYGINYNSAAQVRSVAVAVAQQRMESLRERSFDEVVAENDPDFESAGYHFAVSTTVATSGNLRTVTVRVTPKAGSVWARLPVILVSQRAGTGLGAYYQ